MFQPMTFDGWLMSHFRTPLGYLDTYNPNTPWQSQDVIDDRTLDAQYISLDLAIAGVSFGSTWLYTGSAYAATDSLFFYRLAGLPARTVPVIAAGAFHHGGNYLEDQLWSAAGFDPRSEQTSESFATDLASMFPNTSYDFGL